MFTFSTAPASPPALSAAAVAADALAAVAAADFSFVTIAAAAVGKAGFASHPAAGASAGSARACHRHHLLCSQTWLSQQQPHWLRLLVLLFSRQGPCSLEEQEGRAVGGCVDGCAAAAVVDAAVDDDGCAAVLRVADFVEAEQEGASASASLLDAVVGVVNVSVEAAVV